LALAAWLTAGACTAISARHVRRLGRMAPPAVPGPASRALATAEERRTARELLAEQQSEAERHLALAELWPRSMARISLASGTALAVTSLAKGLGARTGGLPGGMLEFVAGFAGMAMCAAFGRQAREQARDLRRRWRDALKMAARE
jgi:hypothetical protein